MYMADVLPGSENVFVPDLLKKKKFAEDTVDYQTVALFDEHDGHEEGVDCYFDREKLNEICNNTQAKIDDTKDYLPVYVGHIDEDKHESQQGELLGYIDRVWVGDFGEKNPRPTIYGNYRVLKEKLDKAKEFPRRSVELWFDKAGMILDCVAALKRRPQRNLGITYEKNSQRVAKYQYSIGDGMEQEAVIKACLEAVRSMPEFAAMAEYMQKKDEEGKLEAVQIKDNPAMPHEVDKKKLPESADMDHEDESDSMEYSKDPEKLKMQMGQERRKYTKLEAAYKGLEERFQLLEKRERAADYRADLIALEGEGFQFDLAEELELVADKDKVSFEKHCSHIRKRYSKAPIGMAKVTPVVPSEPKFEFSKPVASVNDPRGTEPAQNYDGIQNPAVVARKKAGLMAKKAADYVFSGKAKTAKEAYQMLEAEAN